MRIFSGAPSGVGDGVEDDAKVGVAPTVSLGVRGDAAAPGHSASFGLGWACRSRVTATPASAVSAVPAAPADSAAPVAPAGSISSTAFHAARADDLAGALGGRAGIA